MVVMATKAVAADGQDVPQARRVGAQVMGAEVVVVEAVAATSWGDREGVVEGLEEVTEAVTEAARETSQER